MKDFQYDKELASDYQLIQCYFNSSSGVETVSSGSQLSTDSVRLAGTDEFAIINADYGETLSYTFQMGKYDCKLGFKEITPEEFSKINRWLNRKESHKFKVIQDGYEDLYFLGRFNIQAIKANEKIYGAELTFTSDYPYGFVDEMSISYNGKSFMLYDHSDEIGDLYPYTQIKCLESGELRILNSQDDEIVVISNCKANEVITIDNKNRIISSNLKSHDLANDFNYNYLKIINTYEDKINNYTSSLNIEITFKYSPIRKVGI